MKHEERIRLLLSMQEQPELFSDEQLQQLLADDPELKEHLEELTLAKLAFVKRETDEETIIVEEEWEKFVVEHADDLEHLAEEKPHTPSFKMLMAMMPYKVAASIALGILFTAGLAFAAIYSLTPAPSPKGEESECSQGGESSERVITPLSSWNGAGDEATPVVFDNVPLEKILSQIASHYHKKVEFQNDDARLLRFYFVWKHDETLDAVLHRLNLFESVTVELKSDKIVVE